MRQWVFADEPPRTAQSNFYKVDSGRSESRYSVCIGCIAFLSADLFPRSVDAVADLATAGTVDGAGSLGIPIGTSDQAATLSAACRCRTAPAGGATKSGWRADRISKNCRLCTRVPGLPPQAQATWVDITFPADCPPRMSGQPPPESRQVQTGMPAGSKRPAARKPAGSGW